MGKAIFGKQLKVKPKTATELQMMRKSGQITSMALKKVIENARVGVSLLELDGLAEEEIVKLGGEPSFKTVAGYYWTTCLTLNEEVVHGIPREIKLKEGDVLGIDLGTAYPDRNGWHTDAAWSVIVEGKGVQGEKRKFLEVGERVLWEAISQAVEDSRIGDISAVIQEGIEGSGYSVVKSLAGHGVGKNPHEEPEIPTFGKKGTGLRLKEGMTLAIEVIYAGGKGDVHEKDDGWTIVTVDKSLGGLFEMSVIVGKKRAEVLTDWRKISKVS